MEEKQIKKRGKFVVVDGIDGVGKGVFLDTFIAEAVQEGRTVFDVNEFWKKNNAHPKVEDLINSINAASPINVITTSEPTYQNVGKFIREEMIANKNKGKYSLLDIALAFSQDREQLYRELLLPALNSGINVYQSRSLASSLVYQFQMALEQNEKIDYNDLLTLPGNKYCYQYPMDYLVIPTIFNAEEAVRRSQTREKQDDCIFENLPFQLKIKEYYESKWFQELFQKIGVVLVYLDAGKTVEHSQHLASQFYHNYLSKNSK